MATIRKPVTSGLIPFAQASNANEPFSALVGGYNLGRGNVKDLADALSQAQALKFREKALSQRSAESQRKTDKIKFDAATQELKLIASDAKEDPYNEVKQREWMETRTAYLQTWGVYNDAYNVGITEATNPTEAIGLFGKYTPDWAADTPSKTAQPAKVEIKKRSGASATAPIAPTTPVPAPAVDQPAGRKAEFEKSKEGRMFQMEYDGLEAESKGSGGALFNDPRWTTVLDKYGLRRKQPVK